MTTTSLTAAPHEETGPGAGVGPRGGETSLFYVVPAHQLVPDLHPSLAVFQTGEPVFATGYLVGLLEAPCMTFLRQHRARPGQTPVGAQIAITHRAAAIPGDRLQVTARCTDEDPARSRFSFTVTARNQHGTLVADGHVVQYLVDTAAFRARLHTRRPPRKRAPMLRHWSSTSRNADPEDHESHSTSDEDDRNTDTSTTGGLTHRLAEHGFTHRRPAQGRSARDSRCVDQHRGAAS